jgi:hypothetical protein
MTWRPRNETPEDLARETNAASIISRSLGVTVHKLSEALYGVDWAFSYNNKVVAFAEFKARKKKYSTLLLSAAKYMDLVRIATSTGLPTFMVVQWDDGLWYYQINKERQLTIEIGGNSRGQNGDIEPVVHIPVEEFNPVE